MSEPYMTMAEIEAKYPNEWVFIANATTRRGSVVPTGGVVVFHSLERLEFLRMVEMWDGWGKPAYRSTASWYTGKDTADDSLPIDPIEQESGAA